MARRRGNNEGGLCQRASDGRWQAQVTMPDGSRKTAYGKTRTEARDKLKALQAEAERAGLIIPGATYRSLREFFEAWLVNHEHSLSGKTPMTYRWYIEHYTQEIMPLAPAKLTPQHIQKLYAKRFSEGLSSTTVRHLHDILHAAFAQGVKQGVFASNLADRVSKPRFAHHEMETLTAEQARKLLEALQGDRYEALFVLALTTSMREGELFGLKWDAVDLERGILRVFRNLQYIRGAFVLKEPKRDSSRRVIYLSARAIAALAEHRARWLHERTVLSDQWDTSWDLVFCTYKGTPVWRRNVVERHFEPALSRAKLPSIRFHDLRHTAATLLLEAGIHPKVVSEMLGHSSVAVTMNIYAHTTPAMHRTAAAAFDQILATPEATDTTIGVRVPFPLADALQRLTGTHDRPLEETIIAALRTVVGMTAEQVTENKSEMLLIEPEEDEE